MKKTQTILFFLLLFSLNLKVVGQPGAYWYIGFYLFDNGEMVSNMDSTYSVTIAKSDSIVNGYSDFQSGTGIIKDDKAIFGAGNYGRNDFSIFHIEIIKADSSEMNVYIKLNEKWDIFESFQFLNYTVGNFHISKPDIINKTVRKDSIDVIFPKTGDYKAKSDAIYSELVKHADDYFENDNFQKAQNIYEDILGYLRYDDYVSEQIEKCRPEIKRQMNEHNYNVQISFGDTAFEGEEYEKAKKIYIGARRLSKTRDEYLLRKIEEIETIEQKK